MSKANWMSALPDELRSISIIHLAIPGTHNSMTYGITLKSRPSPDAPPALKFLNSLALPVTKKALVGWSKNQSANVMEQLNLGVRYFDLRLAQRDGHIYYCHGFFAMEWAPPMKQIRAFLAANSGEFVILDFQHNYQLTDKHHHQVFDELKEIFGSILYTHSDGTLIDCTLKRCKELGKQVILIYRRAKTANFPHEFWSEDYWPTPYPEKDSVKDLKAYLGERLTSRNPSKGYVSQCVLTPSGTYLFIRLFTRKSLVDTAKDVNKGLCPWINAQEPGPFTSADAKKKVNILAADFVNLNNGEFCNWVIGLNNKYIKKHVMVHCK